MQIAKVALTGFAKHEKNIPGSFFLRVFGKPILECDLKPSSITCLSSPNINLSKVVCACVTTERPVKCCEADSSQTDPMFSLSFQQYPEDPAEFKPLTEDE